MGGPDRRAYLIHRAGDLAGFALTRRTDEGRTSIVAFFVLRALRGQGVGHRAALELLRQRPGRWGIAFQEENLGAGRFWRRVATAAVGGAWRKEPGQGPDIWLLLDTGGTGASTAG